MFQGPYEEFDGKFFETLNQFIQNDSLSLKTPRAVVKRNESSGHKTPINQLQMF